SRLPGLLRSPGGESFPLESSTVAVTAAGPGRRRRESVKKLQYFQRRVADAAALCHHLRRVVTGGIHGERVRTLARPGTAFPQPAARHGRAPYPGVRHDEGPAFPLF